MTPPEPGQVAQVAPGILWLRLPLPLPLGHVNAWLLEDGEGWLAVDAGGDYPDQRAQWEAVFAHALRGRPITRVLATHAHPDHVGLAGWLCRRWQAPLLVSRAEHARAQYLLAPMRHDARAVFEAFWRGCGCTEPEVASLLRRRDRYQSLVTALPTNVEHVEAGRSLRIGPRDWRVLTGGGHSVEQVMLQAEGLLIAADQVLPGITPHIGFDPEAPGEDPLAAYLASLSALRRVPDAVLVLPSHGTPWYGLHARLTAIADHHAERLDLLARAAPLTPMQALPVLFRRPPREASLGFALTETVAHLRHLVALGRLLPPEAGPPPWRWCVPPDRSGMAGSRD